MHQAITYKKQGEYLLINENAVVKYINATKKKSVLKYYNESIAIAPNVVCSMYNRSAFYRMKNDYNRCIDDCTKVIDLLQNSATALDKHIVDNIDNVLQCLLTLSTTSMIKITKLETIIKSII